MVGNSRGGRSVHAAAGNGQDGRGARLRFLGAGVARRGRSGRPPTPHAVLEKLAGIQMLDVTLPTTDARQLIMPARSDCGREQMRRRDASGGPIPDSADGSHARSISENDEARSSHAVACDQGLDYTPVDLGGLILPGIHPRASRIRAKTLAWARQAL